MPTYRASLIFILAYLAQSYFFFFTFCPFYVKLCFCAALSKNRLFLCATLSCEDVWRLGDEGREVPQLPGPPAASVRALRELLRLGSREEKRALLPERGHGLLPRPRCRQQLRNDGQEARQPLSWVSFRQNLLKQKSARARKRIGMSAEGPFELLCEKWRIKNKDPPLSWGANIVCSVHPSSMYLVFGSVSVSLQPAMSCHSHQRAVTQWWRRNSTETAASPSFIQWQSTSQSSAWDTTATSLR